MSVQSVALASLTATYTDSEGEDGVEDDLQENSNTPQGAAPHNAQVGQPQAFTSPKSGTSASNSPVVAPNVGGKSSNDLSNAPTLVTDVTSKVQRLVSYFDDTIVSDDEGVVQTQIDGQPFENGRPSSIMECSPSCQGEQLVSDSEVDPYGVVIPPEPSGQCPVELQEKITKLFRKMESGGLDMNKVIQQRKDFRNPSIYEKLVQFCSINELGTNYPPDRFDPFKWGKDSYYEELAKVQKAKMDKLEKARKEKTKIEIVSGTAKRPNSSSTTEDDAKKRKSKWDQVATGATASIKPTVLLSQPTLTTLTSSATGTKATKRKLQRISHKCEYNIDSHNMRSYIHIAIHVIHKIDFLNLIVGFVERYQIDLSFYILWDKLFWKYIISMTFVRMIINKDASSRQLSITYRKLCKRRREEII